MNDQLLSFYEGHKEKLLDLYPGLTSQHLIEVFNFFCGGASSYSRLVHFQSKVLLGIPLAYITHEKFFFEDSFYVNESVLIPRQESEILVEMALKELSEELKKTKRPKVIDIGCGSGCLGLSLANTYEAQMSLFMSDIGDSALSVARVNESKLRYRRNPKTSVTLLRSDRLYSVSEKEFDLIITNPPYIKKNKGMDGVHGQVHQFEPHLALYLDDKSYDAWFSDFFSQSADTLKSGGVFLMEGHEDELPGLLELAKNSFASVELKKDYTGRWRFLKGFKDG